MRILFTFAGGNGHFQPLAPLARVAQQRGHAVAFACQADMLHSVRAEGFLPYDTGGPTLLRSSERMPLVELDAAREDRAISETFAGRVARERAHALLTMCAEWRPDVVVRDEVDFGSALAAERLGLPYASVLVIAAGVLVRKELVTGPLNALRRELGLEPDPDLGMLWRYLVLSPFPPSFRHPSFPLPPTAQSLRPFIGLVNHSEPEWLTALERPLVYFTLGTIFNLESGDLFERVLQALADLPVSSVVTVGRELDPTQFGQLPRRIRLERYVAQEIVLPHCSLVLSHAGSGSVMGALTFGLPSVLLPMGADQPQNAARCADLGVARVLDTIRATPADIRDAITDALANPAYRRAAARLRDEIQRLPSVEYGVDLLERLAATRRPVAAAEART